MRALDVPPGSWSLDGHTSVPMPALAASVYIDAFNTGFADGFARWGILGEVRNVVIGGWLYGGFAPLTDADEIAHRVQRRCALPGLDAHEAAARRWLDELLQSAEDRRRDLGHGLADLDDAALAARVTAVGDATRQFIRRRFADTAIYELVAEYVLRADEVAGWDPPQALAVLAGSTGEPTATTATHAAVTGLAEAIAAEPQLSGDLSLDELRAVPAVARILGQLLTSEGDLPVDTDLVGPTLAERPDVLVHLVRARLRAHQSPTERTATETLDAPLAVDVARARLGHEWRERTAAAMLRHGGLLRRAALELGGRLAALGRLDDASHALDLTVEELASSWVPDHREIAAERAAARRRAAAEVPPALLGDRPAVPPAFDLPAAASRAMARMGWYASTLSAPQDPPASAAGESTVRGIGAAPGRAEGTTRVVHGVDQLTRVEPGDVLICATTAPAWTAAISVAAALVCDHGGMTSHPALIARELGIPAVVGTRVATSVLVDGARVVVDGSSGTVRPA